MKKNLSLLLMLMLPCFCIAQKHTISGYVRDGATAESLIGSAVFNRTTLQGTSANVHGFYSITLPRDSVRIVYSYVGYAPVEFRFLLQKDTVIDVNLSSANQLDVLVVSASREADIQEASQMSSINVSVDQIKNLPALLGQVDVLKIIQLMPGVKSSEGSTGLYVRGGGADQNLMLLDGVPVYNAAHLFGFFSVFNADAINRVELIKGGFPARYGGRLSSVIDINMKDGNMKEFHGEGSIDIIASKFTVEGPIKKDRTSFLVSARRTYLDILAMPIIKATTEGGRAGYFFYDLNTKFNHIINRRNRIYLSTYTGDDKAYSKYDYNDKWNDRTYTLQEEAGLKWGNIITALRWNSVVGPRLFSNLTATYSRYRFNVYATEENIDYQTSDPQSEPNIRKFTGEYISGIRDWATKLDFDFVPNPSHYIKFGGSGIIHRFTPGAYSYTLESRDTTGGNPPVDAYEMSAYIEDDIRVSNALKINAGVHFSSFNVEGRWYKSAQPRISGRYLLSETLSLKASFATMMQFIHLLTNAGLGLPTDLWVPSTARVRPQTSSQVALGVAKTYKSIYEFSLETYYKRMSNLIEYKDGASFADIDGDWQDKVAVGGKGESYGAEVLVQKKKGHMTGWIGYTLSWTNRQFDELNNGKWYPYKYDRRHDVSVAMTHDWNKRMDFSMVWVYGTGNSITLPTSQYAGLDQNNSQRFFYRSSINYYGDRNSFRMRAYHRLDLSFSFWKDRKWGRSKWTLAAYNVYSRRNPFYMDLTTDSKGNRKFAQYSLFPIIPSISWSFKF